MSKVDKEIVEDVLKTHLDKAFMDLCVEYKIDPDGIYYGDEEEIEEALTNMIEVYTTIIERKLEV